MFMIKTLSRLGIEGNFLNLNLIKDIYIKATTNIHGERLNAFFLRLRTRQGCSHSQLLDNIILKVIGSVIK